MAKDMRYIVDIDNTICFQDAPSDYPNSTPIKERIRKINTLFDAGHEIIYWTARGAVSKIDWRELTEKQLTEWGCKYHELRMNKPHYDVWIDDKADWIFR
jgi:CMP-N,N'-diacetyllegionaminic acid synthase